MCVCARRPASVGASWQSFTSARWRCVRFPAFSHFVRLPAAQAGGRRASPLFRIFTPVPFPRAFDTISFRAPPEPSPYPPHVDRSVSSASTARRVSSTSLSRVSSESALCSAVLHSTPLQSDPMQFNTDFLVAA